MYLIIPHDITVTVMMCVAIKPPDNLLNGEEWGWGAGAGVISFRITLNTHRDLHFSYMGSFHTYWK